MLGLRRFRREKAEQFRSALGSTCGKPVPPSAAEEGDVGKTMLANSLEQSCSSRGLKGILSWVGSGLPRLSISVLFGLCACWGGHIMLL